MELKIPPNDFCIPDCPYMQLEVSTNRITDGNGKIYYTNHTLTCINTDICSMWAFFNLKSED